MPKYTVYGLPGVYNVTPLSLNDGDGVALAVNSSGQLIVVNAYGSGVYGNTEYTDGGVPPAHPKGSTIEWSDGANWQTVSTAKPLPVAITSGDSTGFTLESGGNLDDIDAALDNIVAQETTTSGVKGLTAFGAVTT